MLNKITALNTFLSSHMFYITLTALILGYTFPINKSGSDLKFFMLFLFATVTFFSSIAISLSEFFQVLKKPKTPLWMLFIVHVCTPAVIYFMGMLFYHDDAYTRVGMLIASILPMGVSAIIWVSIMRGNIAISITAITLDTLVAPFVMALFIKFFFQEHINIDYRVMLSEMLLMVSVPSMLGIVTHSMLTKKQELYNKITAVGSLFSKLCLLIIVYVCVASIMSSIKLDATVIKLLFVVYLMVITSFILAYTSTMPFKNLERDTFISLLYTVGVRNLNFGIIIAVSYFHPAVALPITLMTLFQQPTAAMVAKFVSKKYK